MDKAMKSPAPDHFECIVCQMTTASLPCLHRHQTYRHTSEELSLSIIGLQSSLINSVRLANSIAYDNSWLCDPAKQAEFYTVSARLLNERDDNANHCAPVDYARVRENIFFATEEVKEEIVNLGAVQLTNDYGDANHNLPIDCTVRESSGIKSEHSTQTKDPGAAGGDTNCVSEDAFVDAESLEKVMEITKAEEAALIYAATQIGHQFLGEERKIEEPEIEDAMVDPFVHCVEELCSDLKKTKRKTRKRKTSPFRIPAPRKAKARGKAKRAYRKKSPKSDSVPDNTEMIMQKTDEETEISVSEDSASVNCVQRTSESQKIAIPVDQDFASEDIVEDRPEVPESKAENCVDVGRDEGNLSNGNFVVDCHVETFGSEVTVSQDSADANSVEKKSEDSEQETAVEMDLTNDDCPANSPGREKVSSAAEFPAILTVPCYPPEISGFARILVFDPENHQLVWNSVSIADTASEFETWRGTQVLPELTEADLQDSEICESTTTTSVSRAKDESEDSSLQSRRRGYTAEDIFDNNGHEERKPRTNFVLRPRKVTRRRSQRHSK